MNGFAIGPLASTCIILLGVFVDGSDKWFSCAERFWKLIRAWGILSIIICLVNQACSGCQTAMGGGMGGGGCGIVPNDNNPQPPPDDNPPGGNPEPPPQPPTGGDGCQDTSSSSTQQPVVNVPVPAAVCIICGYAHPNGVTHDGNRSQVRSTSGCGCSFLY